MSAVTPSNEDNFVGLPLDDTESSAGSDSGRLLYNNTDQTDVENAMMTNEENCSPNDDGHDDGHDDGGKKLTWGRGIIQDFRTTVGTHWCKEMSNFSLKTIGVSIFIFFAAVAPAITFGAVYAKSTNNNMGAIEMLTATAWNGIFYGIIGGMPMMINGATGPVLAIQTVIYEMSRNMDIPFLTLNAWTGLWLGFLLALAAFVDLNRIMHHLSRFTDEIFASLIASIFILDAIGNPFNKIGVAWYFVPSHDSHDAYENDPNYDWLNTAFLSLIVMVGTCSTAFFLRNIKHGRFFPNQTIRNLICDFAVFISLITWVLVANVLFSSVKTEKLNVPDTFAPTFQCCDVSCATSWPADCPDIAEPFGRRPWLVDLGDLNGKQWAPFFAIVPALLAFILVFLDDGITWHLINKSFPLKHGEAYNYDSLVIAFLIVANSIIGLPWLVASTVPSVIHVQAMAEKNDKGRVTKVIETRLTHILIHGLILASIFALGLLRMIPVPVLYGVFLFMGIASLATNEFWHRFKMLFMQPSRLPEVPYTKYVPLRKQHLLTGIQIFIFILLTIFRSVKVVAIAFPVIIKLCIPVRMFCLPKIFTEEELALLDGEDEEIDEVVDRFQKEGGHSVRRPDQDGPSAFDYTAGDNEHDGLGAVLRHRTRSERRLTYPTHEEEKRDVKILPK